MYAADDLGPVVAGGLLKDAGTVLDPAALGVGRAEIEPPQPGEGDCLGAHGAGFQRDVDVAVHEPRRAPFGRGGADGKHLGVRRRVAAGFHPVAGPRQHRPGAPIDHHRAHGHFAPVAGRLGFGHGEVHGRRRGRHGVALSSD